MAGLRLEGVVKWKALIGFKRVLLAMIFLHYRVHLPVHMVNI